MPTTGVRYNCISTFNPAMDRSEFLHYCGDPSTYKSLIDQAPISYAVPGKSSVVPITGRSGSIIR
ncbi:hypothetical protein NST99_27885 [Paenibacillus sp. FSL L8-0470]|uniref:hypothetical protein n=1 Tax=Paenibacillus sp. FSL L8-0470 TaxID=2954688 RepID=UPI0030F992CA